MDGLTNNFELSKQLQRTIMFSSFFDEFPELIDSEFRSVTILDNGSTRHIPPGNYAFLESFCTDSECDCHNVFIHVISDNTNKVWAASQLLIQLLKTQSLKFTQSK